MSHEEIITKQTKLQQKPISKIWIYSPQATNITQKSAETEQKSIPVEANGKPQWKYLKMLIFSNQSLEKSLLKRLSASKIPPAEPQKAPPLSSISPYQKQSALVTPVWCLHFARKTCPSSSLYPSPRHPLCSLFSKISLTACSELLPAAQVPPLSLCQTTPPYITEYAPHIFLF